MGKYGEILPKGMLQINGKAILEWQIEKLKGIGINDVIIVTGYKAETIKFNGVDYCHNANYAKTNMLESLMCAHEAFDTDILISYADILFSKELVEKVTNCTFNIGVAVDSAWRDYWRIRYGSTEIDLETLMISEDGSIREIGKPVSSSNGINLRYIGLLKFSKEGIDAVLNIYNDKKSRNESWKQSGKPFKNGYMTDILHELITSGVSVYPVITEGGWLEFDTERDYEMVLKKVTPDKFNRIFAL